MHAIQRARVRILCSWHMVHSAPHARSTPFAVAATSHIRCLLCRPTHHPKNNYPSRWIPTDNGIAMHVTFPLQCLAASTVQCSGNPIRPTHRALCSATDPFSTCRCLLHFLIGAPLHSVAHAPRALLCSRSAFNQTLNCFRFFSTVLPPSLFFRAFCL